jgi:hypothetical protein
VLRELFKAPFSIAYREHIEMFVPLLVTGEPEGILKGFKTSGAVRIVKTNAGLIRPGYGYDERISASLFLRVFARLYLYEWSPEGVLPCLEASWNRGRGQNKINS